MPNETTSTSATETFPNEHSTGFIVTEENEATTELSPESAKNQTEVTARNETANEDNYKSEKEDSGEVFDIVPENDPTMDIIIEEVDSPPKIPENEKAQKKVLQA